MRHTWTGEVRRCPVGHPSDPYDSCPPITNLKNGFTDWALIHCNVHGNVLLISPEFLPFVEVINQETALFYCYECGETEALGVVPEKYRATTPCRCQRKDQ